MTFDPILQVSLHGKAFGLNTTGLPVMGGRGDSTMYGGVMRSSADVVLNSTAMMFAQGGVTRRTAALAASTVAAYGFVSMTSASATAVALELSEPIAGVEFILHIDASASEITLGASSSLIHFASTLDVAAADRTTALFVTTAIGAATSLAGAVITMRGISTALWQVVSYTGAAFPSSGERGLQHVVG